jgi:hypothetical protein
MQSAFSLGTSALENVVGGSDIPQKGVLVEGAYSIIKGVVSDCSSDLVGFGKP